ncbi:hypothetical protein C0J52_15665, partial [Blattella germanica]
LEHNSELTKFGACRIPRPKVIKVSDEYPHPSKTYFPHCTILHRCSDDTGCCSSDSSTCAALKMEQVERFFYVSTTPQFIHYSIYYTCELLMLLQLITYPN